MVLGRTGVGHASRCASRAEEGRRLRLASLEWSPAFQGDLGLVVDSGQGGRPRILLCSPQPYRFHPPYPHTRPPPRRRLAQKPGVRAGESTDSGTRAEAAAASEEGWSSLGCPHFDVSLAQFSCGSMPPISKMNESTFLFFFSFLFL